MSDLVKRLRIKAGMIEMGEHIAWGSDSALMREAADALEVAAPAVQGDVPEETINAVISLVKDAASTRLNSELNSCLSKIRELLYTAPQPAECTLNPDREQITEVEAPSNSLPSWSECNLRVGNSEWLKDNDIEADHDSLTANPLHEFIYEYDDSDAYKSAWFLHRLEKLIDFIRSEPQPDVSQLVEARDLLSMFRGVIGGATWTLDDEEKELAVRVEKAVTALAAYRKQGG